MFKSHFIEVSFKFNPSLSYTSLIAMKPWLSDLRCVNVTDVCYIHLHILTTIPSKCKE